MQVTPTLNPSPFMMSLGMMSKGLDALKGKILAVAVGFSAWKIGEVVAGSMLKTEQQLIVLETTFQSAGRAVVEYQKALKYASTTPFDVVGVIESIKALNVAQLDAWKGVDKSRNLITLLGDMAASQGISVNEMIHVFTQATRGEFEMMKNRFSISAKVIPQLKGLTSGTKEYAAALIDYLAKQPRFIGGMDKMAKSIKGMISNLEDVKDLFLIGMTGVADSKSFLGGTTLYDSVRNSIRSLYTVASDAPIQDIINLTSNLDRLGDIRGLKMTKDNIESLAQEFQISRENLKKYGIAALEESEKFRKLAGSQDDLDKMLKGAGAMKGINTKLSFSFGGEFENTTVLSGIKKIQDDLKLSVEQKQDKIQDLLLASGLNADKVLNQGDKIMQAGRIMGQYFKTIWDVFIHPMFEGVANGFGMVLNFSQKFMDWLGIPLQKIAQGASMSQITVEGALKRFGFHADEFNKINDDKVKASLFSTRRAVEKQMMIFTVILKFIQLEVVDYIERITRPIRAGFGVFFSSFGNLLSISVQKFRSGFGDHIPGILRESDKLFKSISEAVGKFFLILGAGADSAQTPFAAFFYLLGQVAGIAIRGLIFSFQTLFDVINYTGDKILGLFTWVNENARLVKAIAIPILLLFTPILLEMGAAAVASGLLMAASFLSTQIQAGITFATLMAGHVKLAAVSLWAGLKMAAAWLIALGPIGWVIAAVGLASAAIYYFWDDIVVVFNKGLNYLKALPEKAKSFYDELGTVGKTAVWVGGILATVLLAPAAAMGGLAFGAAYVTKNFDTLSKKAGEVFPRIKNFLSPIVDLFQRLQGFASGVLKSFFTSGDKKITIDSGASSGSVSPGGNTSGLSAQIDRLRLGIQEGNNRIGTFFSSLFTVENLKAMITPGRTMNIPSFDVGAWNIPKDMVAQVHAGEMIIPAFDASKIRSGNTSSTANANKTYQIDIKQTFVGSTPASAPKEMKSAVEKLAEAIGAL